MRNGKVDEIETGVDDTGPVPLSSFVEKNEEKLVFVKSTDKSSDIVVDILGCMSSEVHVILADVEGERI